MFIQKVSSRYIVADFSEFHRTTRKWLKDFLKADMQRFGKDRWKNPPAEALKDFAAYAMEESTTLYRGLFWAEADDLLRALKLSTLPKRGDSYMYDDEYISSWSKDLQSALNFTHGEKYFVVLTLTAKPEQSFLDVTSVPGLELQDFEEQEEEVILKPGRYETKIERISDTILESHRKKK